MTLQGDLNSFDLPDVLRLLAGAAKSGRFEVLGDRSTGELRLEHGRVGRSQISSSPTGATPAEVLFELLRLEAGTFSFVEGEPVGDDDAVDVEVALAEATALVAEWEAVEAVVPTMTSWLTMVSEIDDAAVQITADRWRTLAAIGSGATPEALAATLDQGALVTCQSVKDLVELALIEVDAAEAPAGEAVAAAPVVHDLPVPEVELDSFEEFEEVGDAGLTGLEELAAEDGPVIMEDREDALLPEPLPGEGVAYEGEELTGVVDGRTTIEPEPVTGFEPAAEADPMADVPLAVDPAPAPIADDAAATSEPQEEPGFDPVAATPMPPEDQPRTDEPIAHDELADATAFAEGVAPEGHDDEDDERGSLLRFLSTVKP